MNTDVNTGRGASAHRRIEDYAMIGNTLTAALVGRDGSLDWLCLPRFDSPACFARMLGTRKHGRWLIAPRGQIRRAERCYVGDTLILQTVFTTDDGRVRLTDFMPLPRGIVDDGDGAEVIRIARCERGSVAMRTEVIFRFNYGEVVPWVRRKDYGLRAIAGPDALVLRTPIALEGKDFSTVSEFTLHEGDSVSFMLSWFPSHKQAPAERDAHAALEQTRDWWNEWSAQSTSKGKRRETVARSLVTLKALTYSPTGGLVAAATTSLPERLGGDRNWDYRYCWLRDATFTLYALLISGYEDEARQWHNWLLRAVAGEPSKLQIMYGLAGERRLHEQTIPWLPGFAGSAPVRIGNGAHGQRQMDVYGEIMDAFHVGLAQGLHDDDEAWAVQRELMNYLSAGHWSDLGSGLWESRAQQQAYTFSRVMTWVAFDRAVKAVERFGLKGPADEWRTHREVVREDIFRHGFDAERNSFVQCYGSKELDAALLLMPLVGFIDANDPRMQGTIEAIQRELTVDGLVARYDPSRSQDGVSGSEGVFVVCSFWLADNLAMSGHKKEATALFDRLLSIRNDVGLLSEEYDPHAKRQLGNFPQAFSHVGLINTAHNLALPSGPAANRAGH